MAVDADRVRGERRVAVRPWIPADARSVPRTRLVSGLTSLEDATVVVVSGPAGSGKSTLARQWADADVRGHVHLAVEARHNDPSDLAAALIGAFEAVGPPARRVRGLATSVEPTFSAQLLPALTGLAASRSAPFVLVVDDVHLVTNPLCQLVLAAATDGVPAGSQLALMSREGVPAWLGRARAAGTLFELGPADIAFDDAETEALFQQMGIGADAEAAQDANRRAEGWAVGVYLSALALADRRQPAGHLPLQSSARFVGDYVRTEVLSPLDNDMQDFLVHLSVLDELTPSLCDAVLQRGDSGRMLAEAHARNQLVVEVGDHRYRFHHLLRDALLTELRDRDSLAIPLMHLRASQWYRVHEDLDAAIKHAKVSGDLNVAGALVWSGIVGCIGSGRPDRLQAWLADLSDTAIASDRWLSLSAAWAALQSGDITRRDRWTLTAERHAGRDWQRSAAADEYSASLAVLIGLVGRSTVADSVELCESALDGLPPDSGFRTAAAFIAGVGQTLLRRFDAGRSSLLEAQRLSRALNVPLIEADATAWLGLLTIMAGDVSTGAAQIASSADLLEEHDLDRLATAAHTLTALALAQALRQESAAARSTLNQARRMMSMVVGIAPWFEVCGRCLQARTAVTLGEGSLARQLIAEARVAMTPELAGSLAADLVKDAEDALAAMRVDGVSAAALTAAEMRVLQFLPSHLSFRQIGEHLFLSANTIKTHCLSIYRKLDVSSRDEAVARAQALGLVEGPLLN
jgi:LuxR family maltose regulon positive regulatory protein